MCALRLLHSGLPSICTEGVLKLRNMDAKLAFALKVY